MTYAQSIKALQEVDIESVIASLAESTFHGHLISVGCPRVVNGPSRSDQVEMNSMRCVVLVHDSELVRNHLVLPHTLTNCLAMTIEPG